MLWFSSLGGVLLTRCTVRWSMLSNLIKTTVVQQWLKTVGAWQLNFGRQILATRRVVVSGRGLDGNRIQSSYTLRHWEHSTMHQVPTVSRSIPLTCVSYYITFLMAYTVLYGTLHIATVSTDLQYTVVIIGGGVCQAYCMCTNTLVM